MGILDRVRKPSAKKGADESATAAKASKPTKTKAVKKAAKEEVALQPQAQTKGNRYSAMYLKRPHVSEKAARLASKGTYVFQVPVNAEKIAIKKAVEALYSVQVAQVRTQSYLGKPVTRGRRVSKRADWKKALVTLKPGQQIDLYAGV